MAAWLHMHSDEMLRLKEQLLAGPGLPEYSLSERYSATDQGGSSMSQNQEEARNMRACML